MGDIKNKLLMLVFPLLLLASMCAHAEWSKVFEVDYVMGDGDNRMSARQAAVEQIKLNAANQAGTYIQRTTTLEKNGDLTEKIQMLSASMVKVQTSSESLGVNKSGQAVLRVKAVASLDEAELVRRIDLLRKDKARERLIKELQEENDELRRVFTQVREALAGKQDPSRTAELLAKQSATYKRIEDNGKAMALIFERGTLLQMANRNADALERAKQEIDDEFLAPLMQTPVTATIESVQEKEDGYEALVRISWEVDFRQVKNVLGRYLTASDSLKSLGSRQSSSLALYYFKNIEGTGHHKLSDQLFRYLKTKKVSLQISLANNKVTLPVLFVDGSFFQDCSKSESYRYDQKNICLVSHSASDPYLTGSYANPVRIRLSRAEAELATRVETQWVMVNDPGS